MRKLDDMSSITNRAIVSSSGFSSSAKLKAEHREVDLYVLEKWAKPIDLDFPRFGLKGLPEEAIRFSQSTSLLAWVEIESSRTDGATQLQHRRYRPTSWTQQVPPILDTRIWINIEKKYCYVPPKYSCTLEPATTMVNTLPWFHSPTCAVTAEWPNAHTLEVSSDEVHFIVDDLVKLERLTITGSLRWERKKEQPDFRVMRRVRDGKPFAGALVAPGVREGTCSRSSSLMVRLRRAHGTTRRKAPEHDSPT